MPILASQGPSHLVPLTHIAVSFLMEVPLRNPKVGVPRRQGALAANSRWVGQERGSPSRPEPYGPQLFYRSFYCAARYRGSRDATAEVS